MIANILADLGVAFGFLILTHGPAVAVFFAVAMVATLTAVVAVHHLRRDKPAPAPTPKSPAVAPRVYGSRRPAQHRRTSFVRHVADYRKTGANR